MTNPTNRRRITAPRGSISSGGKPDGDICGSKHRLRNALYRCLLLLDISLGLAGCGTVHFDAPEGRRVKLLALDDPASVRVKYVIWYGLWGAKVMNFNHTAPLIATNQLTEVRMFTEVSLTDNLINPFASIVSFSRRTLIIEGNRRQEATP